MAWLAASVLLTGCARLAARQDAALPAYAYAVPPGKIFDMAQGRVISADALAKRLRFVRLLFIGEHHTDPRSHRFQLEVLERLAAQRRHIVVALEMFPPSADPVLDQWRRGKLHEADFLRRSDWYEHWGFPWGYYRDLFLFCRAHDIPMHGVNAEDATRKAVHENKLDGLSPKLRAELGDLNALVEPRERYVLDSLRAAGHGPGLREGDPLFQRMYRVQRMWDRLMGGRAARLAEAAGPDSIVVLLIGSGHLAYGLGANLEAARTAPLPAFTAWDAVVKHAELDKHGRYPVAIGMADAVRVYLREDRPPPLPAIRGVRLVPAPNGVKVTDVFLPKHAPLSALKAGDVILALQGTPIKDEVALRLAWEGLPYNQPVKLSLLRDGKPKTLTLLLRPSPHEL